MPNTPPLPPSALRPSVSAKLTAAASNPLTPVVALVTALSGAIGAWQAYQESQSTARASYEALKLASETQGAQIDACRKAQIDLRTWVEELSDRLERRQVTTEKAIRKVTKAPPPSAAVPPEPAPKAPPVEPAPPAAASLPAFDALASQK